MVNVESTINRFNEAAEKLESATTNLRDEATWLENNFPLSEWDERQAASYLESSRASREYEIRQRAAAALRLIGADYELAQAVSRGHI